MLAALTHYAFLRNAVYACLLASVVCGVIGVVIVEKKLIMMSGGIAHTAYGGVGLGYLLGVEPMLGAVLFSLGAAFGIGAARRKGGARTDVIIALFWSLGMALGIAFISLMPGYPPDMGTYLFGNILSVTRSDLWLMLGLTAAVCLAVFLFFNDWKAYLFDPQFSAILGLKTTVLEYGLLLLIALTVVVLIRVAGIILSLALLTAPAATAAFYTRRLGARMLAAAVISAVLCFIGLWISYAFDLASGATVIVLSVAVYALALGMNKLRVRAQRKKAGAVKAAK